VEVFQPIKLSLPINKSHNQKKKEKKKKKKGKEIRNVFTKQMLIDRLVETDDE
jgi:hypothetical protein